MLGVSSLPKNMAWDSGGPAGSLGDSKAVAAGASLKAPGQVSETGAVGLGPSASAGGDDRAHDKALRSYLK